MLHHVFNILTQQSYRRWLSVQLEGDPEDVLCYHDCLGYRMPEGSEVTWSRHKIYQQLRRAPAETTVALLWDLCRSYDHEDETSAALRSYCSEQFGIDLEPVPFFRQDNRLITEGSGTKIGKKKLDGLTLQQQDGVLTITLEPTNELRQLLLARLKDQTDPRKSS